MEDVFGLSVSLIFLAIYIASMWRVFEKAGIAGYWAMVPIANIYVLIKIAGKNWWWMLLLLIPFVNIIIIILILHGVSTNFGKSARFSAGLIFLSPIFFSILALGDAEYEGSMKNSLSNNQIITGAGIFGGILLALGAGAIAVSAQKDKEEREKKGKQVSSNLEKPAKARREQHQQATRQQSNRNKPSVPVPDYNEMARKKMEQDREQWRKDVGAWEADNDSPG